MLAAKMREAINLVSDKPDQVLPFVDKSELRQALNNSDVSVADRLEAHQGTYYNASVMESLPDGYPSNGVINLVLFIDVQTNPFY